MAGLKGLANEGNKVLESMISKLASGKAFGGGDKAINRIGNNLVGVGEMLAKTVSDEGMTLGKAFDSTFRHASTEAGKKGALNYGKMAGSYIGAAAAGRIITGGGLTQDKNGNTNLIGVPFV